METLYLAYRIGLLYKSQNKKFRLYSSIQLPDLYHIAFTKKQTLLIFIWDEWLPWRTKNIEPEDKKVKVNLDLISDFAFPRITQIHTQSISNNMLHQIALQKNFSPSNDPHSLSSV